MAGRRLPKGPPELRHCRTLQELARVQGDFNREMAGSVRGAPSPHRLLAHSDGTDSPVARGALIKGSATKWSKLLIGAARTFIRSTGTDLAWALIEFLDLPVEARGWTDDGGVVRLTTAGDAVGVGTASPNSKFHVAGPIALAYTSTTIDLTLNDTHSTVEVDTSAGNRIITLPTAVGITGRVYAVKRITAGANTLTVDGNGAEAIDGAANVLLPNQWDVLRVQSNGAGWIIIARVLNGRPSCRAFHSAAQATTTGVQTVLALDSERFDTLDPMHDLVTNNSRITIKKAGKYGVGCCIEWASNATGQRSVSLRVNGTTVIDRDIREAAAAGETTHGARAAYDFAANDYVEIVAAQSSGGNLNVQSTGNFSPEMWATKVDD